jgi:putative heme transporter
VIVAGITSQTSDLSGHLSDAKDTLEGWLKDLGVDPGTAKDAKHDASSSANTMVSTLLHGIAVGIEQLSSLVFFLALTALSLLFLLKDGPSFRQFVDSHMGVPLNVAQTITGNVISSLRRYFGGVTIVAAFNAVVVGIGALALDVPLAGTIAVVTFVTAYIPFIGAFVSGAFAVVLALGSEGTQTALIMLVIVLLANGLLQNVVQPIAFGATLRMNPLLVLVATIGFGAIFGMAGLVLGAPLTSAVIHITGDLAKARLAAAAATGADPAAREPEPSPGLFG